MPVLGCLTLSASGQPVPFFGLELPALLAPEKIEPSTVSRQRPLTTPLCLQPTPQGTRMHLDQKGLATRRAVLGNAYVDGALAKATPFTAPLQELVTKHAWGNTWQREGLDMRTRSIVTVSMLVALGRMHELKVHVRGALNNGVTQEELQEIFLHASVYCGFPAAVDAFRSAAEVIDAA
jgi:4-carboxymuconolactone decarboxylase